jgi:hypothetical protein
MRKFYLENSIGERKDLQLETSFFESPEGLGTTNESEYERRGNGLYSNTLREAEQINILGDLVFMDDQYANYKILIDWIFSGYDLSFVYAPSTDEYYCDIDVEYINKGQISEGALSCPCSFLGKTPWYAKTPIALAFVSTATGYKKYTYAYPYKYSPSSIANVINILPAGHYPALLKLVAAGEVLNPSLTLKNASTGEVYGKLQLEDLTIAEGESLVYATGPSEFGVWKDVAGVKTDLDNYLNLAYDNFFSIPVNTECLLTFSHSGTSTTAILYVYQFYRTV